MDGLIPQICRHGHSLLPDLVCTSDGASIAAALDFFEGFFNGFLDGIFVFFTFARGAVYSCFAMDMSRACSAMGISACTLCAD